MENNIDVNSNKQGEVNANSNQVKDGPFVRIINNHRKRVNVRELKIILGELIIKSWPENLSEENRKHNTRLLWRKLDDL